MLSIVHGTQTRPASAPRRNILTSPIKIVIGTRPQIIKMLSLARALDSHSLNYSVIHTGQHYDFEMNESLFEELNLPKPDMHLEVGSGSHAEQTGKMLAKLERALQDTELAIVPGDTNSALAGGLAAVKMGTIVGHVEAGVRSRQIYMPEEINRILIDHMSQMLFAPTVTGQENLSREGIPEDRVHLTGDVMADNICLLGKNIENAGLPVDIPRKGFVYATIHRAENVDNPEKLCGIVDALVNLPSTHDLEVVFPIHPRTRKRLEELHLIDKLAEASGVHTMKAVGYLASLRLAKDARIVLTDSGGLQKEAFMLGTPTITARPTTEWVETVHTGWSKLTGTTPIEIDKAVREFMATSPNHVDPMKFYGEGKASERIARLVKEAVQ